MMNEGEISKRPKSALAQNWHAVVNAFDDRRQAYSSRDSAIDKTFARSVSDFTIDTDEHSFKVHKIVLAARSEVIEYRYKLKR